MHETQGLRAALTSLLDWSTFGYNLIFEPHIYGNQHIVRCCHDTQNEAQKEDERVRWL
jgi:hypothetical protein